MPLVLGTALAFGYTVAMRVREQVWSINPLAFALGVHPIMKVSNVLDRTISFHAIFAFVWLGAVLFQLTSAYCFKPKRSLWQKSHVIVGRYVAVTSMLLFLPSAIVAPLAQGRSPDKSFLRYIVIDVSPNVLMTAEVVVNAVIGIHKARANDFFAHKLFMFFSVMASLRSGTGRLGIALVQLATPDKWLEGLTLPLGSILGTLMVITVTSVVSWRMGQLASWTYVVNIASLGIFVALDGFSCVEFLQGQ